MNPKEKLPIISDNMNSVTFRPQTVNPVSENNDKGNLTSLEAGNEVKKAVLDYELKLAKQDKL